MPTESDHIALANRNHDALKHLLSDPEKYSEWIATTAFYKAVQVVEAAFSHEGKKSHDHRSRNNRLKIDYPDVWKHYRILWQASCIARYLHDNCNNTPFTNFSSYVEPEKIEKRLIQKRLKPVEELIVSKLSDDGKSSLSRIV